MTWGVDVSMGSSTFGVSGIVKRRILGLGKRVSSAKTGGQI